MGAVVRATTASLGIISRTSYLRLKRYSNSARVARGVLVTHGAVGSNYALSSNRISMVQSR